MIIGDFDNSEPVRRLFLVIRVGSRVPCEIQPYVPFDRFSDSILAAFPDAVLAQAFRRRSRNPERIIIKPVIYYDELSDK